MRKLIGVLVVALVSTNLYAAAWDEYGPVYEVNDALQIVSRVGQDGWLFKVDPSLMPTVCQGNRVFVDSAHELANMAQRISFESYMDNKPISFTYTHDGDRCYAGTIQNIPIDLTPDPDQDLWSTDDLWLSYIPTFGRLFAEGCPYPMTQGEMLYRLEWKYIGTEGPWYGFSGQMQEFDGNRCASVQTHIFRFDIYDFKWRIKGIDGVWSDYTYLIDPS